MRFPFLDPGAWTVGGILGGSDFEVNLHRPLLQATIQPKSAPERPLTVRWASVDRPLSVRWSAARQQANSLRGQSPNICCYSSRTSAHKKASRLRGAWSQLARGPV